jgi:hypothetical protein
MNDVTVEVDGLSGPMLLWERHFKTNPASTKQVNKGGGRMITAIDAYHQIKEATEEWGPMGKWGLRNITMNFMDEMASLSGEFFYPGGSFAVVNSIDTFTRPRNGTPRRDTDWGKKLQTDTITKALSYLGFNADVFFGMFDDARYVQERANEEKKKEETNTKALYDECLKVLEEKRPDMGTDGYNRYAESLKTISADYDRLSNALKILEAIVPAGQDMDSKGKKDD